MKKTCLLILAVLLLLAFSLPAQADEPAKYNFASAQGDKELKIPPGQEGRGSIYFYNIDGNRITHISLSIGQAPEGWEVSIEPPLGETQVLISGMPVTVEENLYVEPSELLIEEPQSVPEGMVSIKVPGRGYAFGRLAQVVIRVPETASPGSTGVITIAAEAAWLGQSGAAAVKQARDFEFSVTVVSGQTEYTEEIIGQGKTQLPTEENTTNTPALPSTSQDRNSGSTFGGWLPAIIAAVVVIVGVTFVVLFIRRRG